MRLRRYHRSLDPNDENAGVMLVEPDDPEELIAVAEDDVEAMDETRPRMIVTPEEARAAGALAGAELGATLDPSAISISWAGSEPTPAVDSLTLTGLDVAKALAEWARTFQIQWRQGQ
jgi:phage tail tape-measure protein